MNLGFIGGEVVKLVSLIQAGFDELPKSVVLEVQGWGIMGIRNGNKTKDTYELCY